MFHPIVSLFTVLAVFLTSVCAAVTPVRKAEVPSEPEGGVSVTLPLGGGSDPWFYEHDGTYYWCYSLGNGVGVKSAETLAELYASPGKRVYTAPGGTAYSSNYWAPELHYIDGRWYIYVAADDGANENHRMYVLSCDTPDGEFVMEGKICDSSDKWAIDGTVLRYKGELWFIWSGWEDDSDGKQNIFIAHMSDPTHIDSDHVRISSPVFGWERRGMPINEGPEILYHGDSVFLVYSASGSWTDDYCLGMLTLTGDPGCAPGWVKNPIPVFSKTDTAYGPGHCSFITFGGAEYIVYHANEVSGTGWNGRSIRIQPFIYRLGAPVFGKPLPAGSSVTVG
ncbi:MAG: glycoside hydrolase family 43 protein [Clostridia bacterium]|nr:glycoside hydrolase family 43 protein [Clostridia bacterium]